MKIWDWFIHLGTSPSREVIEITRLCVRRMFCPICNKALEHGDLVVRRSGTPEAEATPLVHASCGVRVRTANGDILGQEHPLAVILTETMWKNWLDSMPAVNDPKEHR